MTAATRKASERQSEDVVVVLVGGPADGRRVRVDGRPNVYFVPRANRLDMSISPRDEVEARFIADIADEYVRRGRNIYVHHSLLHLDEMDLLTAGYRPEIGK